MTTKVYGNTNTHLILSGKALEYYNLVDPIRIDETENNGTYLYTVFSGSEPMHDGQMTEKQLIRWMEDGYDEYITGCIFRIKPQYLNLWGQDATVDTVLTYNDLVNITRGWETTPEDVMYQLEID